MPSKQEKPETEYISDEEFIQMYVGENDPVERLELAEDMIQQLGDEMGFMYIKATSGSEGANPALVDYEQHVQERVATQMTKLEKDDQPRGGTIENFRKFYVMSALRRDYAATDDDSHKYTEELERLEDSAWESFVESLGFKGEIPDYIAETLIWLRDKIENKKIVVIDSESASDLTIKNKAQQAAKDMAAPFAFIDFARIGKEPSENLLVICIDLMSNDSPAADWLLALAHERGHDIMSNYRYSRPSELGDTEIVFREFFPRLEEQRIYELLKSNGYPIPDTIASSYEVNEQLAGVTTKGVLPHSNVEISYTNSKLTQNLLSSYGHSLEARHRYAKVSLVNKMIEQGASPDEIMSAINNLKIVTESVIKDSDIQWRVSETKSR